MNLFKMQKTKLNIITTLMSQLVAICAGIIIPRVMIVSFGSAVYGLTTSISQFLSYVSLLEGGIGRVARAELYEPLAKKDSYEISRVYYAIKRFFFGVGIAFIIYTLILSFVYRNIANVSQFDNSLVFVLIWVISATTLAKYFWGLANLTLLNADQKQYVGNLIVMSATIANAVLIVILAAMNSSVTAVKSVSSLVYVIQPVCYYLYVKKHYRFVDVGNQLSKLSQKWTGIGQHIAYFLHTNTDIVMLTVFSDIRMVAVYSVYWLVITSIRKIAASFTGGMEARFGELIAKNDLRQLQKTFWNYKFMLSVVTIIMFGTTAVLIVPFVKLYTSGINDANYVQPMFAMVLILAEALDCVIHPCFSLPIAANKLKQTRLGAYGEALINIVFSLILIWWQPLLGIAIGTLLAALFKCVYYMVYSAKNILNVNIKQLLKNFIFTVSMLMLSFLAGMLLYDKNVINSYLEWVFGGVITVTAVSAMTILLGSLLYPDELKELFAGLKAKLKKVY